MGISKFASHYMLSPDGKLKKWPVVAVDEGGVVKSVDFHQDGFQEAPGVRFFSGLMLPAFIDCQFENKDFFRPDFERIMNRHFSKGTLYFVFLSIPEAFREKRKQWPKIFESETLSENHKLLTGISGRWELPIFERIRQQNNFHDEISLAELLDEATRLAADNAGLSYTGRIEPGCIPGLILIQNMDLINLKLQSQSTIKWLNIPDGF